MSRWTYTGVAALVSLLGCQLGGAAEPQAQPPVLVEVAKVALASVRDTSDYLATLKSRGTVTLRPQVDGLITHIAVHSGQVVKRGALLMQIDPARQQHTLASQRAGAISKKAALDYADQELGRVQRLFAIGAASQQELDQAKSAHETTQAELEALGAQVRENEVRLQYFSVLAPEDGVVGDIPVREGDHVSTISETLLTTVTANRDLELYVSVPVEKAAGLKSGLRLELTDVTGRSIGESRVSYVSSEVQPDTQSVLVKGVIPNPTGELREAQVVHARLVWSEGQGPVLPVGAIKRFNGQAFAFAAVARDGHLIAEQRAIQLGPVDGASYPIEKGLAIGETIVVSGVQKLHDGSLIAPLEHPAG
jgi:RND family efflux transporter MFP subunit